MKKSTQLIALSVVAASLIYGFAPTGKTTTTKAKATTSAAGLEWSNGLEASILQAKRTNRPILFLSMFGKLDEKMPCANARTLRATLFKDPAFHELARDQVVLGWEMVRPVPHVTIDLGDGKPIERTVRGNAVMYLLNSSGKVLDAFPGIYTAGDFIPTVKDEIGKLANADAKTVRDFHVANRRFLARTFALTASKSMVESPTLEFISAKPIGGAKIEFTPSASSDRQIFESMAGRISDMSLMPRSSPDTVKLILGQPPKGASSEELAALILQSDSKRNVEVVRPVVHAYLASETELPSVA
ncbi:MAG: hypothetical protein ABL962_10850, partial [Fimbriimonadaceae bacterium]